MKTLAPLAVVLLISSIAVAQQPAAKDAKAAPKPKTYSWSDFLPKGYPLPRPVRGQAARTAQTAAEKKAAAAYIGGRLFGSAQILAIEPLDDGRFEFTGIEFNTKRYSAVQDMTAPIGPTQRLAVWISGRESAQRLNPGDVVKLDSEIVAIKVEMIERIADIHLITITVKGDVN